MVGGNVSARSKLGTGQVTLPRETGRLPRVFKEVIWLHVGQANAIEHRVVDRDDCGRGLCRGARCAVLGEDGVTFEVQGPFAT